MRVIGKSLALVVCVAALGSCGDDASTNPAPDGPSVAANASNQFQPGTLDIAVGETVTWVFGPVSHDVVFSQVAGAPANITISVNRNVSRTFATAGVYPYQCSLHSGMAGAIRVGQ